jgi:hypothetical protein
MSLKIIFFIFAALAGLALIGSLSPAGKKQTTSRNRNRESGFHGPYGFPKCSICERLGEKGKICESYDAKAEHQSRT